VSRWQPAAPRDAPETIAERPEEETDRVSQKRRRQLESIRKCRLDETSSFGFGRDIRIISSGILDALDSIVAHLVNIMGKGLDSNLL
jgi:hypothetical protein